MNTRSSTRPAPSPPSKWSPLRLLRGLRRRWLLGRTELSAAERFVVFVGNPRSGTTLVRSLLNAHPSVLISNEVHVLRCIAAGESWNSVLGRILDNERQFSAQPVWTGYDYNVPQVGSAVAQPSIRVIGDKKACRTSQLIEADPTLIRRLQDWSRLPVRFIHCVRHPFDVITTKTRRNGLPLRQNIDRYFRSEQAAISVHDAVGDESYLRIYQEDLIDRPEHVLQELLQFIGLDAFDSYVRACRSVIYDKPRNSRHGIKWPASDIVEVEKRTKRFPHLHSYLTGEQLQFHEHADQTNRPPDCAAA